MEEEVFDVKSSVKVCDLGSVHSLVLGPKPQVGFPSGSGYSSVFSHFGLCPRKLISKSTKYFHIPFLNSCSRQCEKIRA